MNKKQKQQQKNSDTVLEKFLKRNEKLFEVLDEQELQQLVGGRKTAFLSYCSPDEICVKSSDIPL